MLFYCTQMLKETLHGWLLTMKANLHLFGIAGHLCRVRSLTAELIPQLAKALEGYILTVDEEGHSEGMDEDVFCF